MPLLCILRLQISRDPSLHGEASHPLPSAPSATSAPPGKAGLLCLRELKRPRLSLPHSVAFLRLSSSSSSQSMPLTDCSAQLLPHLLASHMSELTCVSEASFIPSSIQHLLPESWSIQYARAGRGLADRGSYTMRQSGQVPGSK